MPALVRMELWLGLAKHHEQWRSRRDNGEFNVYAETVCTAMNFFISMSEKNQHLRQIRISCHKILKNLLWCKNELPKDFCLNGHVIELHPRTQKLETNLSVF